MSGPISEQGIMASENRREGRCWRPMGEGKGLRLGVNVIFMRLTTLVVYASLACLVDVGCGLLVRVRVDNVGGRGRGRGRRFRGKKEWEVRGDLPCLYTGAKPGREVIRCVACTEYNCTLQPVEYSMLEWRTGEFKKLL